ncbi:hypothetical protein MOOR_11680 [Moorella thermoacetica]|uniref:GH26 domain-containing protein n=1 Tax=Neomoorella thermoacetica TaxID=1525 RepID=A0A1J5JZY2_NEOTH|nr:stalk domain-containing protein [Moorella thermoacetica]OIQ09057.1 hypothetical protein MOOR_11680 [Moorella thermoacetica]
MKVSRIVVILLFLLLLSPATAWADPWQDYQRAGELEAVDPAKAESLYRSAAAAFEACGDLENAGLAWQKIFHLYDRQGKLAEAGAAYVKEAALFQQAGVPDWAWGDTARSESLKSVLRLFFPVPDPGRITLAKFEPAAGTYLGLYEERGPAGNDYNRVKDLYGRQHALFLGYGHIYGPGNFVLPRDAMEKARRVPGAGLVLALEPNGGLEGLREGDLVAIARELAALKIPIFLRFASEMNMEGTNAWHGDPAAYVSWFRRAATIMRREAPNVALVWNPFDIVQPEGVKAAALEYYPGDDYVDWVGVNFYSDYYLSGRADQPGAGLDPLQRLDYWYRIFAGSKPLMVGEFGIAHTVLSPGRADVSRWAAFNIRKFYRTLPLLYPRVKAVVYFDLNESDPLYTQAKVSDYRLDDNQEVLTAYREAIADPHYLEQVGQEAPGTYRELEDGMAIQGEITLGAAVKLYDPFISRVEYYLNGELLGSPASPPYQLTVDFNRLPGEGSLVVKAYDSQGREAISRTFTVFGSAIPVATFTPGQKGYTINGQAQEMDVAPFIENGRTYVPLRYLALGLGVPEEGIGWDPSSQTVTLSSAGHILKFYPGRAEMERDGRRQALDVAPLNRAGRVFLPARYVAEALGYRVTWSPARQQVLVIRE